MKVSDITNPDDGAPAFPFSYKDSDGREFVHPGMSQWDWIAAHVLQGMLAHPTRYRPREGASSNWHEAIAEEAYQIADAMLAVRARLEAAQPPYSYAPKEA